MISDLESIVLVLDFELMSNGASFDALIIGTIRSTSRKLASGIKSIIRERYLLVPSLLSLRYNYFFLTSRSSLKYRLHL